MGSTFFSLHYHIIFSTKERRPLIRREWQPRLHSYLGGIIRGMNGVAQSVGGVSDHVHLLVSLGTTHRISDVLRDLKKDSTNWVKENFDNAFRWQEGYAAFTVSPSGTNSVRRYIENQEEHHRKKSFVDELKELLEKAGIAYDEKFLL
ncbi:MAG: REP-associated tyrosine transposase [Blastocatellia bacterium]|jgi:REP element-mobilizing transposase RayT|nr:REP-associated tyrosine transposase [Blastocatellia bacterium]